MLRMRTPQELKWANCCEPGLPGKLHAKTNTNPSL
jgi:hypothetical protein